MLKLRRRFRFQPLWHLRLAWHMSGQTLAADEPLGCLIAYFPVRLAWFVVAIICLLRW